MSRIGKMPIMVPKDVEVSFKDCILYIVGPLGELSMIIDKSLNLSINDGLIKISSLLDTKYSKSIWGTTRSIVNSMLKGVHKGFTQELEINGVGYKASMANGYLNLSLGKSHNTKILVPKYITIDIPKQNLILLKSYDKEKLGQFASVILKQRPVEPYKGKGIFKKGQYIHRKEGKKG